MQGSFRIANFMSLYIKQIQSEELLFADSETVKLEGQGTYEG